MSHPISEVMQTTLERIRQMVDANTIIGEPIVTSDVTIIPVTNVKIGFASGGSDFAGKNPSVSGTNCFGGGSGAGVTVTPVGFLVVKGESVRLLPVTEAPADKIDRAIEMLPDLVDKISAFLKERKAEKDAQAAAAEEAEDVE